MTKVRRFFYVAKTVSGRRRHRVYKTRYNPVEGDKTACGLVISKGWGIGPLQYNLPICKRCERAA